MVALHLPEYIDDRVPGSYFPNPAPPSSDAPPKPDPFMSWAYVVQTLSHGDLDQLFRDPVCDTAYRAYAGPVRAQYGGLENYIRQIRLGWPAEAHTGPVGPNMLDRPAKDLSAIMAGSASGVSTPNGTKLPMEAVKETWPEKVLPHPRQKGIVLRHFVSDAEVTPQQEAWGDGKVEDSLVKVIPNDWPYGIPAGSTHWVVWSKLPILHPSLFLPTSPFPPELSDVLYECVTGDGIRGFTGFTPSSDAYPTYEWQGRKIPEVLGSYSQAKLAEDGKVEGLTKEVLSQAHAWEVDT